MTLKELIHKHEFEEVIPHLTAIDPAQVPNNLYAFKEAFDELRRLTPGNAEGKQIAKSTPMTTARKSSAISTQAAAKATFGRPPLQRRSSSVPPSGKKKPWRRFSGK